MADTSDAPILRASGLRFCWPTGGRPVLDGVGLGLWPGQLVSIIGDNGAGKTTLLRFIAGLLTGAGEITLGGIDFQRDRVAYQRRLGLLTAGNSGLYGRLRVSEHLDLQMRASYVPLPARARRRATITEALDLGPLLRQRADRISMGQRQRVRLALTFIHAPQLALLDEPTTSLDTNGYELLERLLARHRERGGATVWCSPGTVGSAPVAAPTLRLADGQLRPV